MIEAHIHDGLLIGSFRIDLLGQRKEDAMAELVRELLNMRVYALFELEDFYDG